MYRNSLEAGERQGHFVEELTSNASLLEFYRAKNIAYGHENDPKYDPKDKLQDLRSHQMREPTIVFGIKVGDSIIAGGQLDIINQRGRVCGYAWNKFVLPEYQKQGLGQKIDEARTERARQEQCEYVFALVSRKDRDAINSVELSGYKLTNDPAFNAFRAKWPGDDVYIKGLK